MMKVLERYKKRLGTSSVVIGDVLREQSDMLMNATFTNSVGYKKCILRYDLNDPKMKPIPTEVKYLVVSDYSITKDQVEYMLQFRPTFYPEKATNGKLGIYIDIPNEIGEYETWLIIGRNDETQFIKYNILKCNWLLKWVKDGIYYTQIGCLRNKNSYNAGIKDGELITYVDDQVSFWVGTNEKTKRIDYQQRFLITENEINPVGYMVTKREDIFPPGTTKLTLKQVSYSPTTDLIIDKSDPNKPTFVADWYSCTIEPIPYDPNVEVPPEVEVPVISYKFIGNSQIKNGGSERKVRVEFYKQDLLFEGIAANWEVYVSKVGDKTSFVNINEDGSLKSKFTKISTDELQNTIILRLGNHPELIGRLIKIKVNEESHIDSFGEFIMEVVSL